MTEGIYIYGNVQCLYTTNVYSVLSVLGEGLLGLNIRTKKRLKAQIRIK